ncbi:MAG: TrmO family methyltransferase [Desulforegulaceae bacterium]|nr:TrmO family methyltransferase [Desulforegulaceae bacterium]
MSSEIKLNPIGNIEIKEGRFYLSVKEKYKKALKAIEGFSHINIVWWANRSDTLEKRDRLIVEKPYKKSPDTLGIFATRSEIRPNPVLITTAAVISVDQDKGIIELPWIDAENGSPVIDIKPYQPCLDRVKNVMQPGWCSEWPQWYEDSCGFDWESVFSF